jgi:PAS domain-containing protein
MTRKPTYEELEQSVNDLKQEAAKPQRAEQERRWKRRRAADRAVREAIEYAEAVVDTVREPSVVLDGHLRIHSANRFFYQVFKVKPEETLGEFTQNGREGPVLQGGEGKSGQPAFPLIR